jgi:predicted DNA-binding transcriptional regulator YafY
MAGTKMLELLQYLIQRRFGATKKDMAEAFDKSPRQIERYLKQMNEAGLPVVSDGEPNDGQAHRWKIDRSYFSGLPEETPPLGLSFSEIFTITAALESALLPHSAWIDNARKSAIEKLCTYLPGPESRQMPLYRAGVVAIGPDESRREKIFEKVVENFVSGAVRNHVVRLTYPWGGHEVSTRNIEPLGIGLIYGGIYGVACIQPHKDPRWLNLARATRARELEELFEEPKGFDLNAFMRANFGMWHEEPQKVRVKFSKDAAPAIRSREIHPTQKLEERKDGSVVLSLTVGGKREFLWWVLGWGSSAKLLAPKEWRCDLAKEIKNMHGLYRK